MIDIATKNGDLVTSSYGDILLLASSDDNTIQMANSAINTVKGENMFHPEYGNDAWNQRLKMSDSGFETIKICSKEAILRACSNVEEVTSIIVNRGEGNGECVISYTLLTVDGRNISSSTSINIL